MFLATLPDPSICPLITSLRLILQDAHGLQGHVMDEDRLHLTLMRVADPFRTRQQMIMDVSAIAAGIRHAQIPLRFDRTLSFPNRNRHPFVLAGDQGAIHDLRAVLADRMRRAGFDVQHGFCPHVTMLWADRSIQEHPIAPIGWMAREIVLIESGQGCHGHLGRWAFGEAS